MTKKENKKEEKKESVTDNKTKATHKKVHTASTSKKTKMSKKVVEGYRRRNRLIEIIIVCIVIIFVFILSCNKTFLKTNYTQKIGNSEISIDLPRFTYFVKSDKDKIVFKTLRKSSNTRSFFADFLENGSFDIYYCGDSTPYYYNSEEKYFIYDIEVKKGIAIKTITVKYSTVDNNLFCNTVSNDNEEIQDEL